MPKRRTPMRLPAVCAAVLAACSGGYSGVPGQNGGGDGDSGPAPANLAAYFDQRLAPRLEFCRNCHLPGGLADVEDGRQFQLDPVAASDLAALERSWRALGGAPSRILTMASGAETPHSGGAPWPQGSAGYVAMDRVLRCFATPAACDSILAGGDSGPVAERELLGSMRGGHAWFEYCAGKPAATALPVDPRARVQPGANAGRAVYFNAWWRNCHVDPQLVGEPAAPATCGELETVRARGAALIKGNGAIGAGTYFGGDDPASGDIAAADYNRLWEKWGLPGRPDNFDSLVAERYGSALPAERNPYPLEGEDPNRSGGGSGQLPSALTQLRNANGTWTGMLGFTCHGCHSGGAGGPLYGNANSLSEYGQLTQDLGAPAPGISQPTPLVLGKTRGTNNALALQIITFVLTQDVRPQDPNFWEFALLAPNGGSLDAPAWWNVGHRPVKFQDGFLAMDAWRSDLGFFLPGPGPGGFDWIRAHARDGDLYLMSLTSPVYPGAVDTTLAQQGAILFHAKDLWAAGLENRAPRPAGGNGSCASCHGAYSPRYVHDPAYLEDPALEGVASYIVPRDLIATDPARVDSDSEAAEQYGKQNFFAYNETVGQAAPIEDCGPQNRAELRQGRPFGYLAPPLYGVWASAPYFHNGSVPDVWGVLKPSDRPAIWRRVSTPARADQAGRVVMGYDTDFVRAYDVRKLGWKYDALACGDAGTTPYLDCSAGAADPRFNDLLSMLYGNNPFAWYLGVTPLTDEQLEQRKIYNTHMYSHGNGGHEFTVGLTDPERRAIVEYLKTL